MSKLCKMTFSKNLQLVINSISTPIPNGTAVLSRFTVGHLPSSLRFSSKRRSDRVGSVRAVLLFPCRVLKREKKTNLVFVSDKCKVVKT